MARCSDRRSRPSSPWFLHFEPHFQGCSQDCGSENSGRNFLVISKKRVAVEMGDVIRRRFDVGCRLLCNLFIARNSGTEVLPMGVRHDKTVWPEVTQKEHRVLASYQPSKVSQEHREVADPTTESVIGEATLTTDFLRVKQDTYTAHRWSNVGVSGCLAGIGGGLQSLAWRTIVRF